MGDTRPLFLRKHCSGFLMILGKATGGVPNCLSPAKRDEFWGRTEQAIEASKYAAADEGNLALCRIINVLLSNSKKPNICK
jgi:hypothetical protein